MANLTIELEIPPGIVSDDTDFAAQNRWVDGNNIRFRLGKPETIGGWVEVHATISSLSNDYCRSLYAFNRSGTTLAYGTKSRLYVGSGISAPSNRSPAGIGSSIQYWSLAGFGSTLLASPGGGKLYEQIGATNAAHVATAPSEITWMLVTPERQAVAFGCNEEVSGTFNGKCVRWSEIEDYTDWTTASDNNAGEYILESSGDVVTARIIGNVIGIWTTSSLFTMQFIGDPRQTFRFDKVADIGCVGPFAATEHRGLAYFVAPDLRIYRWSPGMVPEALSCPIFRDFYENASLLTVSRIAVAPRSSKNEIWIHYPDTRDPGGGLSPENSRYIAFHTLDGTWFRGTVGGRLAALDDGLLAGTLALNYRGQTVGIDASGSLFVEEYDSLIQTLSGSSGRAWHLTSGDQYIEAGKRRVMLDRIRPDFEAQSNDIGLTLFTKDGPQASTTIKGPYALTTATAKKDIRASGKLISIKLSGGAAAEASAMRLGKPVFEGKTMGER